jgi:hypothetical protein
MPHRHARRTKKQQPSNDMPPVFTFVFGGLFLLFAASGMVDVAAVCLGGVIIGILCWILRECGRVGF